MKYILARDGLELLAQLARTRVLLAFDFDGTLAPIVANRDRANMRARTRRLLTQLCERYPCAVISGRSRADVGARVRDTGVKYVVGNHGLEPGRELARFERAVAAIQPKLEQKLAAVRGIDIEDKRYSLAVHYRNASRKGVARAAIEAAVRKLRPAMRIVGGKLLVNVVPEGAPHKGDALRELRVRVGAVSALYVGDDITDEDAFAHDQRGALVGIRVGRVRASAAPFYLRDQREIDLLLAKLRALRANGRA